MKSQQLGWTEERTEVREALERVREKERVQTDQLED
jgi:hypothetical protein